MANINDDNKMEHTNILEPPHRRSDKFVTLYTNTAGIGASTYDLQLIFGHVISMHPKDEAFPPPVEDLAVVVMAWEHAKAFASALNTAIEKFEKENGPIRVSK
jgi:hypothetical protein